MRGPRRLKLPSLADRTSGRRRRELAWIFALIFGAGIASAPLVARAIPFAVEQVISTLANGAESVIAADIDGDGDLDVLSASYFDDEIAWYENTDGSGAFGSQQVISTLADGAYSIFTADVDGDGDADVLSASFFDDEIAWYENTDGSGSFGTQQVISLTDGAFSVFAADVDGDGDLDVLSASLLDDTITGYENRGGQFGLPTTSLAQGLLADSQEEVLFQIDLEHRGRAGDSDVELATIELRFRNGTGALLTSAKANALIDKLEIFLDDGSGSFESLSDTLVEQITALDLTAGVETISFTSGDANVQVAFGSSKSYFVVITLTSDASAQTPNHFQEIHRTQASSTAQDASSPTVPLTLEYETPTTTGRIDTDINDPDAVCQAPFALDLQAFTVSTTVVCEAGTVLTAANGLEVVSPGDLTLRAGDLVVLGVDFSLQMGAVFQAEVDPALKP